MSVRRKTKDFTHFTVYKQLKIFSNVLINGRVSEACRMSLADSRNRRKKESA